MASADHFNIRVPTIVPKLASLWQSVTSTSYFGYLFDTPQRSSLYTRPKGPATNDPPDMQNSRGWSSGRGEQRWFTYWSVACMWGFQLNFMYDPFQLKKLRTSSLLYLIDFQLSFLVLIEREPRYAAQRSQLWRKPKPCPKKPCVSPQQTASMLSTTTQQV